jgi:hypothetical protein
VQAVIIFTLSSFVVRPVTKIVIVKQNLVKNANIPRDFVRSVSFRTTSQLIQKLKTSATIQATNATFLEDSMPHTPKKTGVCMFDRDLCPYQHEGNDDAELTEVADY